jgi:hypothetical protein
MKHLNSLRKHPQPMLFVLGFMFISIVWFVLAWMHASNGNLESAIPNVIVGSISFSTAVGYYMRATNRLLLDEIDRLKRKIERMESDE